MALPPGRGRLPTSRNPTGSAATTNTIGTVLVTSTAACAGTSAVARMMSTFARTSSIASPGSCSASPSDDRHSMSMFRPWT